MKVQIDKYGANALLLLAIVCAVSGLAPIVRDAHAQEPPSAPATPPVPLDGPTLFHERGCEHCHGENGVGIPDKAPSLVAVGKRLNKEQIEKQIHDGGTEMPAFADALTPEEIQVLVRYLSGRRGPGKDARKRSFTASPPETQEPATIKWAGASR